MSSPLFWVLCLLTCLLVPGRSEAAGQKFKLWTVFEDLTVLTGGTFLHSTVEVTEGGEVVDVVRYNWDALDVIAWDAVDLEFQAVGVGQATAVPVSLRHYRAGTLLAEWLPLETCNEVHNSSVWSHADECADVQIGDYWVMVLKICGIQISYALGMDDGVPKTLDTGIIHHPFTAEGILSPGELQCMWWLRWPSPYAIAGWQTDVTGGVSAVGVGVPCEEATATLKDVVEAVDKVNLSLTNAGPAKSGFEALLASGATELTNLYRTFDSTPAYMAGFTNMTLNVPAPTGVTAPVTGMLTGPVDLVGLWMPRSIREQNWAIWIKSAIALAFTFELMVFGAREALNMQKFQLQLPATTMSSQGSIPGLGGALFLLRVAALAGIMLAAPGFILGYIFDFGNSGILETIIDMMTEGGPQQVMVDNAQGVLLGFSEIWATLNLYVPTVTIGLCAYLRHSWQIGGARLLLLSHWIVRQFPT